MRRLLLLLTVAAPVPALAQLEGVADKAKERLRDDEAAEEPTSEDAGDAPFGGERAAGGETPSTTPESYAVKPGDTLWGLSQRFLNNPWYWPKIWSYNPNLDNPNWINPGTVLRFYPAQAIAEAPEEEEAPIEDIGEGGGFEVGDGFDNRPVQSSDLRRREFFLPTDRIDDAGQIMNSPEEKRLLSTDDRSYVKLKKTAVPGEVLQIFRKDRELRHPVTGAKIGQIVTMVGEVRIDQPGRDQSLGTIVASWDPIERGLSVATLPTLTDPVRRVDNSKNVKGYVVDAAPAALSFLGESYSVVIDKGSADGVAPGNTFAVVRAGDPYTREYSGMTDEDIGELIVIEAFKGTSTGVLTAASRVIVPGDRIEMRTSR